MSPLDWVHQDTTTNLIPVDRQQVRLLALSDLSEQAKQEIRAIIREELQRQEGFLRAMVQEELEAHHDAYAMDELNVDMPPKSSREVIVNVTRRGRAKPELEEDEEETL